MAVSQALGIQLKVLFLEILIANRIASRDMFQDPLFSFGNPGRRWLIWRTCYHNNDEIDLSIVHIIADA
eukprot:g74177.t1